MGRVTEIFCVGVRERVNYFNHRAGAIVCALVTELVLRLSVRVRFSAIIKIIVVTLRATVVCLEGGEEEPIASTSKHAQLSGR